MRRVLVTGATGFIGRAVVLELKRRGARVLAADSGDADLTDAAQTRRLLRRARPDAVVHAAGTARGPWERLWDLNVAATVNLLEALPPGARVVVAGSAAEYGAAAGRRRAKEDGPAEPASLYGAAKLSQTHAALSYRHRGADVVVARVFNTMGPGQPEGNVPGAFARQLLEGASVVRVGGLSARRDFVDVRDVARALADLTDKRVPSGVYNVCSGRAVPVREVLRRLLALWGRPVKVREDAARRRRADVPFSAGDPGKLARAAGWKPRITLEQSLREALRQP